MDIQAPSLSLFAAGITDVPPEFKLFLEAGGELGARVTPLTVADLKKAIKEQNKLAWTELMDLIDASEQATQEQLAAVDDAPVGPEQKQAARSLLAKCLATPNRNFIILHNLPPSQLRRIAESIGIERDDSFPVGMTILSHD